MQSWLNSQLRLGFQLHVLYVVHTYLSKLGCDDVVGPEGMEKFCEDIGVEPENVSR